MNVIEDGDEVVLREGKITRLVRMRINLKDYGLFPNIGCSPID